MRRTNDQGFFSRPVSGNRRAPVPVGTGGIQIQIQINSKAPMQPVPIGLPASFTGLPAGFTGLPVGLTSLNSNPNSKALVQLVYWPI